MITRRLILGALASAPLAACQTGNQLEQPLASGQDDAGWYVGSMDDKPFNVPLVDRRRMRRELRPPERAPITGPERPGSIVVDIDERFLYLVKPDGQAVRYGVGVGRQGFSWRGMAYVGRKGVWPAWSPTSTMVSLKPELPRYREAGLDNPLGARALYLYQDGARHPLPHPRHQRALEHRRTGLVGLRPHAQRGRGRPLQPRAVGTTVYVKRIGRYRV